MSKFLDLAAQALRLHLNGKTAAEIKASLSLPSARDVHLAIDIGRLAERFEEPRLTDQEQELILSVAAYERDEIARGNTCAPKLKYAGAHMWPRSRAAYLAYKRLGSHRRGENTRSPGTGLGLLHPYNGYVRLTKAGWAFVHALESKGGAK
ncbi:MAG: hypothetical protein AB7E60_14005 [Sphingobium sp.]